MLKYLYLVDQVKRINKQLDLSHNEISLLDVAAKAHFTGRLIHVRDLIGQSEIASQATLHSVFKSLLAKKLLQVQEHAEDGRFKNVTLTKASLGYYKKLDHALTASHS